MNKSPFPQGSQVCLYARDSGGSDQDLSISQQIDELKIWCSDNGYIPALTFMDEAKSGSSAVSRSGFQEMMKHFRNDAQEKGVVIWSYSRFAREINDASFYKADLRRRGYIIYSITDAIPEGLDGSLFEAIIAWKDARYLEDLSRDTKRGQRHLIKTHGAVGGRPPKGFIREPVRIGNRRDGSEHIVHRWVVDPETIHLVIQAFELRATGKTYKQIHDLTNLYDNISGYKRLFRNRLFVGELVFGETIIEDYCDPVIDQDIWEAVQAIRRTKEDIKGRYHPRRIRSSFILSGLAFCGECGSIMSGQVVTNSKGKVYRYYRCRARQDKWNCTARNIPQEIAENVVIDDLKQNILTPEKIAAAQERALQVWSENQGKRDKASARIEAKLKTVTRKIGNLISVIGDTGNRTLLAKLQELETRESDLLFQLSRLEDAPPPILHLDIKKVSSIIQSLDRDNEEINDILRDLIQRVDMKRKKQTIRGTIYYYSLFYADKVTQGRDQPHKHKLKVKI